MADDRPSAKVSLTPEPMGDTPVLKQTTSIPEDETNLFTRGDPLAENNPPPNVLRECQTGNIATTRISESDSIESNIVNAPAIKQAPTPPTLEQQLQKYKRDLESMVIKYARSESECISIKSKLDQLDRKLKQAMKDNDQLANRIKILTNDKNHLSDTLSAKVAQLTVLEQKNSYLNNVQGSRLKELEEKVSTLEATNEDLQKQVDSFKGKEGELLDFSERLSMKHLMLQSELDEAIRQNSTPSETGSEKVDLAMQNAELVKRIEILEDLLQRERSVIENLKTDKLRLETKYQKDLDELNNELKLMRRKHQMSIKELTREMKHLRGVAGLVDNK